MTETARRRANFCWYASGRLKTGKIGRDREEEEGAEGEEEGTGCLTGVLDLANAGLAGVLPLGLLVIAGQTVKDVAGPSAIFSAILAAILAGFVGLSLFEISPRSWRLFRRSAYEYVYRTGGEAAAFLVGWLLLLHHSAAAALAVRAVSSNIDSLTGSLVSNFTETRFGRVPILDSNLDLLALVFVFLAMVLSAGNVGLPPRKKTVWFLVVNVALVALLVFVSVVGAYHLQFLNWESPDKFFPGGVKGVFSGTAMTYYIFNMTSESVVRWRDSSRRPKRRVLLHSSLLSNAVYVIALISVTSLMTLLLRRRGWTTSEYPGFPESFDAAGMAWVKILLCSFTVVLIFPAMCTQTSRALDAILKMADDGLIMSGSGRKSRERSGIAGELIPQCSPAGKRCRELLSKTWPCILSGTMTSVGAMILDMTTLSQLVSATVVCVHLVVIVDVTSGYFRPLELPTNQESLAERRRKRRRRKGRGGGRSSERRGNMNENTNGHCYGTTSAIDVISGSVQDGNDVVAEIIMNDNADYISPADDTTSSHALAAEESTAEDHRGDVIEKTSSSSSSSSSSDTDIDEIVDEYEQSAEREAAVGRMARGDDSLLDVRCPSPASYGRSIRFVAVFILSCLLLGAIFYRCSLDASSSSSATVAARATIGAGIVVTATVALSCAVCLLRLPCNERGLRILPCGTPSTALPLVGIFLLCLMVNFYGGLATSLLLICIGLGGVIYLSYGIRHSKASSHATNFIQPEEERTLIRRCSESDLNPQDQPSV